MAHAKVTVMTDGMMSDDTFTKLAELAEVVKADPTATVNIEHKLNGIVAVFRFRHDAEWFRDAVIEAPAFKGKLANLSIGDAS